MRRWLLGLAVFLVLLLATASLWLPLPGTFLVVTDPLAPADAALVLDGTGSRAMDNAERWRADGLVRYVVIVESPVRTHDLVAYWTDFVRWGVAEPSPTPEQFLRVVRSAQGGPAAQTQAALGALRDLGATLVVIPDAGLSSRLVKREAASTFAPAGIAVRVSQTGPISPDPAHWYRDPVDRRAVLMLWLQLLLPSDNDVSPGS